MTRAPTIEDRLRASSAPTYPTALARLTSPESFDPSATSNLTGRHLRGLIGSDLPLATPVDDSAIWDHWTTYLVDRILTDRDSVFVVTGSPGEGKSSMALTLLARVRDRLGAETGTSRQLDLERDLVYRLSELVHRVYESSRAEPRTILCDEAVLAGAQSGSGLSQEGKLLDRTLSIARVKGATLALLIPSIHGIASFVKMRRACLWFHVERRGLTTVMVPTDRLDFSTPRNLPFRKARQPWSKLRWGSLEADPIWAPYSALKLETVQRALVDAEMEASKLEQRAGLRPSNASQMDWRPTITVGAVRAGSGREPGESPKQYHRRHSREQMAAKRAAQQSATDNRNNGNLSGGV